jgi:hypothetical protein
MRKAWRTGVQVYFGLIAAANEYNPVEIRLNDRRWNVAPRQETPIKTLDWWDSKLINEQYGLLYQPEQLQKFANFLASYPVDEYKVLNPMDNDAKNLVMRTTQSLQEDVVHALRHGDADYFVAFAKPVNGVPDADSANYRRVVADIMRGGDIAFTTQDLKVLFEYIVGWNHQSSGKFQKSLAHAGLDTKTIRDGKRVFRGVRFTFHISQEARELWSQINEEGALRAVRPDERTGTDG